MPLDKYRVPSSREGKKALRHMMAEAWFFGKTKCPALSPVQVQRAPSPLPASLPPSQVTGSRTEDRYRPRARHRQALSPSVNRQRGLRRRRALARGEVGGAQKTRNKLEGRWKTRLARLRPELKTMGLRMRFFWCR